MSIRVDPIITKISGVDWERHARALRIALSAKEKLLTCYRIGNSPSESLWAQLEKANASVAAFDAALADAKTGKT